jgi:hypothetical protein
MQAFFLPQYTTASLADVLISVSEFSADTRICNSSVSPTEMLLGDAKDTVLKLRDALKVLP